MIPGLPATHYDYYDRFEGEVIDGPLQGQRKAEHSPYFREPQYHRLSVCAPMNPNDYIRPFEMPYVEYVWVWSLGQWAMRY